MSRPEHPERRPAVVTGASSGIGAATAIALAGRGLPVALGARRVAECEKVAAQIREAGGEAVALPLDLTDEASVQSFAEKAEAEVGPVEVVVSNAALLAPGRIHETDTAQFAAEVDVNVLGAHRLVRTFVPGMVGRKRGDVVLVSSDVAVRSRPFMSAYTASKWALEGMAQAMQMELEGSGVRVSVVRPGPTWTGMGLDWDADDLAMVLDGWSRFGHARHSQFLPPEAIAEAVTDVVTAARGVHRSLVEVSPEPPLEDA